MFTQLTGSVPHILSLQPNYLEITSKVGMEDELWYENYRCREGLFQFKFTLESQLNWVLNNGPWSFENHHLALRRWEKGMMARIVAFKHIPLWVQVWGLPFDLISEEASKDIGGGLGKMVEIDNKVFSSKQACFVRIWVELPIDKLLHRSAVVVNLEGDKVRVGFKYERLVGFYYQCCIIRHEAKECPSPKTHDNGELPYGEWLRAGWKGLVTKVKGRNMRLDIGGHQSMNGSLSTKSPSVGKGNGNTTDTGSK